VYDADEAPWLKDAPHGVCPPDQRLAAADAGGYRVPSRLKNEEKLISAKTELHLGNQFGKVLKRLVRRLWLRRLLHLSSSPQGSVGCLVCCYIALCRRKNRGEQPPHWISPIGDLADSHATFLLRGMLASGTARNLNF
jgi:hypothetical protein